MANKIRKIIRAKYLVFTLTLISQQILALKTINVEDCFNVSRRNDTPSCSFQMSEEANDVGINCVRSGVLQIVGDYKVVYINCTASYPLDFKFDGHKPTEAIETLSWARVDKNSGGKFKSYHLDAKIFSTSSLHDYYVALHPQKKLLQRDSYNYSRTGSYTFSGYHEQERLQSKFYIFFEEKSAIRSFLRNEDVVVRLPNLRSEIEDHSPLVIPCRLSHLNANVTIQQKSNDSRYHFNYDPVVGFTSNESWKLISENKNNPSLNYNENLFTCILNQDDDFMTFSTNNKKPGMKYGYDGLPTTATWSIYPTADTLNNGSLAIEYQCNFDPKSDKRGILAVQGIPNPVMYRLNHHFIFPVFNNRSYSTVVLNETLRYGATKQITTKSMVSNVLCMDATSFHAVTVDVGVTGRYTYLNLGLDVSNAIEIVDRENYNYFKILHDQPNYNALYVNQIVEFRCFIHSFTFIRPAIWYTERANGSIVEEAIDYDWKENYFSHTQIRLTSDVRKVLCAASVFHTSEWRNFSMDIKFEKSVKPTFDNSQVSVQKFPLNSNQILKCTATGIPQPTIYWERNDENISSAVSSANHSSILEFPDVQQNDAGEYVCVASNVASVEKRIFNVQVFVETDLGLIIGLSISVIVCGALAVAAWVYFKLLGNGKAALSKLEIDDFLNGERNEDNLSGKNPDGNEYEHDVIHLRPYNTDFEIQESRFHIDSSQVLGSGAFGMVVMGTLDGISVAVKTVKRNAEKSYLKALLSELKVMTFLGDHDNIIRLLAASTRNLSKGQAFLFIEFCPLGSLQEYLRDNRGCFRNDPTDYLNSIVVSIPSSGSSTVVTAEPNIYVNAPTINRKDSISLTTFKCSDNIAKEDLHQWATQIAQGMEYLSSKKVLHGDLATRNVLLTKNRIAKITDFGLSKRLYDYSEYAKKQQEPLPWRWMSLESLRDLTFSTKSDVWSYGITLWEIFSLGQVPYPGLSWTMDFVKELERGMRMSSPRFASEELYTRVMKECWHTDPNLRPSFAQILENLNTI